MRRSYSPEKLHFDWLLIALYFALVLVGWITIYTVTINEGGQGIINMNTSYGKQFIWLLLSIPLIILVLSIENPFYERYSGVIYIVFIVFLLGLFVFGKNINGQTNWYAFGSISIQPSEFVKIATALALASVVGDNLFDVNSLKDLKYALLIIAVPVAIIVLQKDVGSAIVFLSFILVLFRRGLSMRLFYIMGIFILLFILTVKYGFIITLGISFLVFGIFVYYATKKQPLFFRKNLPILLGIFIGLIVWVKVSDFAFNNILESHHQDRLELWLRMEKNPTKIAQLKRSYGYNNDQSIQTIASGGFFGKGFLEGDRTNGKFVPAQSTDYIFSAIGEQFGFWGSGLVILLFLALILRLLYKADIQKSNFAKYYGYGVASVIFIHFFINIGMVLDLLPTVGIPLPFISYGGSSLWAFTILLFIFIKLDAHRMEDF
jgi:rod shape determining protein RodA